MRASLHIGKGGATHNDRSFDTTKNSSIHPEYGENAYYGRTEKGLFKPVQGGMHHFSRIESEFYKRTFSAALDAKNERYKKSGHKERCQTLSNLRNADKTKPTEIILQLGNEHDPYEDGGNLKKMVIAMVKRIRAEYPQFVLLDIALHGDERSMHAHVRGVFVGHDRDGNPEPNQSKALAEMGIERPNPEEPTSKTNNAMQTFTEILRSMWHECIREVDPITEPKRESRSHVDHKLYNAKKELEKTEKALQIAQRALKESERTEYRAMQIYIASMGLRDDFEDFYERMYAQQYEGVDLEY